MHACRATKTKKHKHASAKRKKKEKKKEKPKQSFSPLLNHPHLVPSRFFFAARKHRLVPFRFFRRYRTTPSSLSSFFRRYPPPFCSFSGYSPLQIHSLVFLFVFVLFAVTDHPFVPCHALAVTNPLPHIFHFVLSSLQPPVPRPPLVPFRVWAVTKTTPSCSVSLLFNSNRQHYLQYSPLWAR